MSYRICDNYCPLQLDEELSSVSDFPFDELLPSLPESPSSNDNVAGTAARVQERVTALAVDFGFRMLIVLLLSGLSGCAAGTGQCRPRVAWNKRYSNTRRSRRRRSPWGWHRQFRSRPRPGRHDEGKPARRSLRGDAFDRYGLRNADGRSSASAPCQAFPFVANRTLPPIRGAQNPAGTINFGCTDRCRQSIRPWSERAASSANL